MATASPAPLRLRNFATRPWARALLIGIAIPVVGAAFIYLGEVVGIAAILLLGLVVPIYLGWKRPRQLAIAGLVILLLSAPVAGALETNLIFTPSPSASSANTLPGGNGGSILQNASVGPFSGGPGTNFSFGVDVFPKYDPPNTTLHDVVLVVSTCPTATGNQTSPFCSAGYPFYLQNHTFNVTPNATFHLVFHQALPGPDIWWWTMYAETRATNGSYHSSLLFTGPNYPTVEGPVTGSWGSIFGIIVGQVYLYMFLYLGIVYYLALLVYTWFKTREARRKAGATLPTAPPPPGAPTSTAPPGTPPPAPAERHCPNCQAVVYESETQCWKCGTSLRPGAAPPTAGAPLPSTGPGPKGP
ncbi:MAG: hypothetical protein L3K04_05515 [Thermoplasmata archaeon]|nr:hypothetical protein [Thermoplasmata archaeon]